MSWLGLNKLKKNWPNEDQIAEMIRASRESGTDEHLSDAVRSRILEGAFRQDTAAESLPTMFTPTRRLVVAGALPVLLAALLLAGLDRGVQPPAPAVEGTPLVAVSKQGNKILFDIHNGGSQHVVYRSTDPNRFDVDSGVAVTDGAYADHLQDQADLVFYRID